MPTTPPIPTQEKPGTWYTKWRSDRENGKRYQHTQRFYGNQRDALRQYKAWLKSWKLDEAAQNPRSSVGYNISDLAVAYLDYAQGYYTKNNKPTTYVWKIKAAMQKLIDIWGSVSANEFTPPMLALYRDKLDTPQAKRKTINNWITVIKQVWSWGSEKGYVHPDVAVRLTTVKSLRLGRCKAGEYNQVTSVHWQTVLATLEQLSPVVQAMVIAQWHTGMRPGEVRIMRPCDIEMGGKSWLYRPHTHKTEHHGKDRVIALGPQCQETISPYLKRSLTDYMFSPVESVRAIGRGVMDGMQSVYTRDSYARAIRRACDKAFPLPAHLPPSENKKWVDEHRWHPHQLRHAKESQIERDEGILAAQLVLGHASTTTTQSYGQQDRKLRKLKQIRALAEKYG